LGKVLLGFLTADEPGGSSGQLERVKMASPKMRTKIDTANYAKDLVNNKMMFYEYNLEYN
jgi:hypothetical protein